MTDAVTPTKHGFQADVSEVLALVVHSLYTHKEVFLRELISNASDAIDQRGFRALTEPSLAASGAPTIDLVPDRERGTLTIRDDGMGMDESELARNLGTIAHSGTKALLQSLSGDQRKDLNLIGQFGVGFYASFLVADRVEVVSRKAGGDGRAFRWESDGKSGFTVTPAERDAPGTDVILHLRESERDFLREWTLRELVRKYSDFVRHAIRLECTTEKDGAKTRALEQVNRGAALWTRPKSEVTDAQYEEFWKHVSHDWEPPLAWTHFKVEGSQELTGLLFLARRAMPDMPEIRGKGVRLFVRRVFIMDDCEDVLPPWLRFVRGVVDSDDLPLNVSREFLQRDRVSAQLRKHVTRKVLDLLEELAAEGRRDVPDAPAPKEGDDDDDSPKPVADRYAHFWRTSGRILAEGAHDGEHGERVQKLLRFQTSAGEELTSLPSYVSRMAESQPAIWYVPAESRAAALASPHAERLRKRGYEVLLAVEPVDEWVLQNLREFGGKKIVSAAVADLELPEDAKEKEEREKQAGELAPLLASMKESLAASVRDVRVSARLSDAPACLVHDAWEASPRLERMLRAHDRTYEGGKRVLEVNPAHPFVRRMNDLCGDDAQKDRVRDLATLLYDQALVAEGSPPSDPVRFARQVADLLVQSVPAAQGAPAK
ncbi:MAG: Chaperone protein HtpG [Planctomycetes bacterium]|nr:Chaperone protein HtpG [Planctomycetota bacterium]